MRQNEWLAIVLVIVLIGAAYAIGYNEARLTAGRGTTKGPSGGSAYDGLATLGQANAPVTIVEYSDFQCPYCKRFHDDAFQQIKTQYINTGKVKFVWKNYPLSFHPFAEKAAEAGQCVLEQGNDQFWQYESTVYTNQAQLSDDNIKLWALQTGVDAAKFNDCYTSGRTAALIAAQMQEGQQKGVTGTPGFRVYGPGDTTGQLVVGAQPFSAFQTVIDAKLGG